MTAQDVYYVGADGRWHGGKLDGEALTVNDGHAPADGREVYHELPHTVEPEDLCSECLPA